MKILPVVTKNCIWKKQLNSEKVCDFFSSRMQQKKNLTTYMCNQYSVQIFILGRSSKYPASCFFNFNLKNKKVKSNSDTLCIEIEKKKTIWFNLQIPLMCKMIFFSPACARYHLVILIYSKSVTTYPHHYFHC